MAKSTIVTGASRGIGYEVACALAEQKHRVLALARSRKQLEQIKQKYPAYITTYAIDLTMEEEIKQFAKFLSEHTSGIDILINNAGGLINKPFTELSSKEWKSMLDINLMSTVMLTKALLPVFMPGSHIVNISSMGGFQGSEKFPGLTAYSVAKGAVSILSECLAAELSDHKISVNALCLGSVKTAMFNQAFPDFEADVSPEQMGTYIADFSLKGATFYNGKVLPVALHNPS